VCVRGGWYRGGFGFATMPTGTWAPGAVVRPQTPNGAAPVYDRVDPYATVDAGRRSQLSRNG
jgi:hypothetical protein